MALTEIKSTTMIRGYQKPNAANKKIAGELINALEYDQIWRGKGLTIVSKGPVRIDHQGSYISPDDREKHHNIQIQVDEHTIAHVDISESTAKEKDEGNQRGVLHAVQRNLNRSLDDQYSYFIAGSIT